MKQQTQVQRPRLIGDGLRYTVLWLMLLSTCLLSGVAVKAQTPQSYNSAEDAMKDLVAVVQAKDRAALVRIFGADVRRMLSGDAVQEAAELDHFATRAAQKAELVKDNDTQVTIEIGDEGWPFPIPLVKGGDQWAFDTKKGVDELLRRRIGRNELSAILLSAAFAVAQWDYFLDGDWNNDGVQEFAQKFISSPGQKDGLYWSTTNDEVSPLGPVAELARGQGYSATRDIAGNVKSDPFHGYYVKMLKAQGPNASGGRYSYVINGHMIGGFAMVAYPAVYGQSGVMTFIVNQQGKVFQNNLGPNTAKIVQSMTTYNPGPGWTVVNYEEALDTVTR